MKILILFFSGIGNAILLTPALKAIEKSCPQAEIHFLIRDASVASVLEHTRPADRFIKYQRQATTLQRTLDHVRLVKTLRNCQWDILISTTYLADKESLLARVIPAKRKIGFRSRWWHNQVFDDVVEYDSDTHEVDRYMSLVKALGVKGNTAEPEIAISAQNHEFARKAIPSDSKLTIGLHPGCSDMLAYKRWQSSKFASLASQLSERHKAHVVLFGGPNEIALAEEIAVSVGEIHATNLAGKASILETAAVIKNCDLFISNDSGLMHLASAMHVPVIGLFGPTSSAKNAPVGRQTQVIRDTQSCPANQNYLCDNCEFPYKNDRRTPLCLDRITVEEVVQAAETLLNERES